MAKLTVSCSALCAILAGPAGGAVAVVVALRRVAGRAVSARRAGAVVAVVLNTYKKFVRYIFLISYILINNIGSSSYISNSPSSSVPNRR